MRTSPHSVSQASPKDVTARKAASPAARSIREILSTAIASSAIRLASWAPEEEQRVQVGRGVSTCVWGTERKQK